LLLLHENDKEAVPGEWDILIPPILARKKKEGLLAEILEVIQPFVEGGAVLDFQLLSPFITYLVHKGATIATARLNRGNLVLPTLMMLKSMRRFLKLVSSRWLITSESLQYRMFVKVAE
jgi:hypothetical protein